MRTMTFTGAASALLIALTIGCSAIPPAPTPVTGIRSGNQSGACGLLSNDQVASVTHRQPMTGGGIETNSGGIDQCSYSLWLAPYESAYVALEIPAMFDSGRDSSYAAQPGIGMDAYWQFDGDGLAQLNIKTAAHTLLVGVTSSTVDPKAAALALARIAVGNI